MTNKINNSLYNAFKTFDTLKKSGNKRFTYIDSWQSNQAFWFKKEHDNKIRKTYHKFDRGTIVFVNFGVNIGSEISGHHFAVVLNTNDYKTKPTITVVPLTSKNKDFYIPLDSTVITNTTIHLKMMLKELMKRSDINQEKIQELDELVSSKILKFTKLSYIQLKIFYLLRDTREFSNSIKQLEKIIKIYTKYKDNSFADVGNIQTISKLKIRIINEYDPSGKIKVTNDNLKDIETEIQKLFLSN